MNRNILHIIRFVHDRHAVFILHDTTEKQGVKPPLLHLGEEKYAKTWMSDRLVNYYF